MSLLSRTFKALFKRTTIEVGSKWIREEEIGNPFSVGYYKICEVKDGWVKMKYCQAEYVSDQDYCLKIWSLVNFYVKVEDGK